MDEQDFLKLINDYTKEVIIPMIKTTCLETQKSIFQTLSIAFDALAKEIEKGEKK